MKNGYKQLLFILGACAAGIALLYYFGVQKWVSFSALQTHSESFKQVVEHNYLKAALLYCLSFAGIMMIGLPISGILTLVGGYLFGFILGFLYSLASCMFGVLSLFIIVRYLFASLLQVRYRDRLEAFRSKFQTHGASYLLTLYLVMVVPYIVIVILAALAEVPLYTFMWTSIAGSVPMLIVYALAGQQLSTLHSAHEILSPQIIVLFVILIALALVPIVIQRIRNTHA